MLKEIDITSALKRIAEGSNQVCMLVPINADTLLSIEELIAVKGFALVTAQGTNGKKDEDPEENPEQAEKKPKQKKPKEKKETPVDKGKIIALYKAGRTVSSICSEVGASYPTVKKAIDQMNEQGQEECQG